MVSQQMATPHRVLVCGDRNWIEELPIRRELSKFSHGTVIIHGGASGADTIAGKVGRSLGFNVIVFPAQWGKYGRAAGPIRNTQMLDEGNPTIVLAFHPNISLSKGTKNMVSQARSRGIKTIVFSN
jgi:hypothetical protein